MRIALLGASGDTGRLIAEQACAAGHEVVGLVREPSRAPAGIDVVQGDATDAAAVARICAGADALLSALGHAKGSPKDVMTQAARHVVAAAPPRVIWLTGAQVRVPEDDPQLVDRVVEFAMGRFARAQLQDTRAAGEVLRSSPLEWTVVRAGHLGKGDGKGRVQARAAVGKGVGRSVARSDVARFMLGELDAGAWVRASPMVWA